MKKTVVALALASVAAPSMAEVVLYGNIKGGMEVTKEKVNGVKEKGTTSNIVDYGSSIGFKGHEHLTDGLDAIWQLEQSVDIAGGGTSSTGTNGFGTKDSFIGLSGAPGTVKAGYLSTPVKEANGRLDTWEYNTADDDSVVGLSGFTRGNDAVKRQVAASYTTPNMGGFSATAYVAPSDNNGNPQDPNREAPTYGVGLNFENSGFFADVAGVYVKNGQNNGTLTPLSSHGHASAATKKDKEAYQALAQVGYENDDVMAGVAYQRAVNVDKQYDIANEVAATVGVNVAQGLKLKGTVAYGFNISDAAGKKLNGTGEYIQGIMGADYALSKRTVVNAQVGYKESGKGVNKDAKGTVGLGLSHKF